MTSIVSEILVSMISRRSTSAREERPWEEQSGFRHERGCIDQIFVLHPILENKFIYRRPTLVVLFDVKVSFNFVDQMVLRQFLLLKSLPNKQIHLKAVYSN